MTGRCKSTRRRNKRAVGGVSVSFDGFRAKTTELLVDIARTRAVVVVEHDMEFVRRLNCKVTVVHGGAVDHAAKNQDVIDEYLGWG